MTFQVIQEIHSKTSTHMWATWSTERCPCPWQQDWNKRNFRVSFDPAHFLILSIQNFYRHEGIKYYVNILEAFNVLW